MEKIFGIQSVKRMPLMELPVRSTLLHLKNSRVLIAPGSGLSEAQLKSLGPVNEIVATNLLHTGGMSLAAQVFPQAKLWGVEGSKKKRPEIAWDEIVTAENWPHQDELPVVFIKGMPLVNEIVFFHRESKTLIVTDLVFNLTAPKGLGSWSILNLFGTYRKFAVSRLYLTYIKDKESFMKSMNEILVYDFENVVMAHGDVVKNAKSLFIRALGERGLP